MSTNKRFGSLRLKLVLPFALLGLSVSSVLAISMFLVVSDLTERNIHQVLLVELEDYRSRKLLNQNALPITTQLVQGYFLPEVENLELHDKLAVLDPELRQPGSFVQLSLENEPRTVLIDEVAGQKFTLVHNNTGAHRMLGDLGTVLVIAVLLMTGLSAVLGQHLAGQVVRPISRLLGELNARSRRPHWPDEFVPLFSAGEFPPNEIGRLALALDEFAERLHQFIVRERHFVGDVSHELRTPIAIIRGAAEVARELPDLPASLVDRLDLIQRRAARMGDLLDALLLLAREHATGPLAAADELCPISEVVDEAISDCRPIAASKSVSLGATYLARPYLPVERSMAFVVISNLIRNACTHTAQGSVKIALEPQRLVVEDTGIGISPELIQKMFQRFEKGETSSGSGIGLSIVARLCEAMNWQIDITSQPGQGTTVTLNFATGPEAKKTPEVVPA